MRGFKTSVNHQFSIFLLNPDSRYRFFASFTTAITSLRHLAFQRGGELYQRLRKLGKRFSVNAFMPSF
jgi:hypothetical protein